MNRSITLLALLYVVEGLPYGFQASALGPYLRSEGVSLRDIGLLGLLAAPWMLKALWAPLVDRYHSPRIGRRRSWLLPMQALLAAACFTTSMFPLETHLTAVLVLIGVMNLFAATLDVAVDGLAIDVLRDRELGRGNAAQVVGYKIGMLIGGGLLLWASSAIGWSGHFVAMGSLVVLAFLATLAYREDAPEPAKDAANRSMRAVLGTMREALRTPGAWLVVAVVATYKLGEALVDPMYTPFLVDAGFSREDVGLWNGSFGMIASVLGSFAGGWLATRFLLTRAITIAGAMRALALASQLALAFVDTPTEAMVIAVTIVESFLAGALSTTMFAFMMSTVDPRVGATHYTLLAGIEVGAKAGFALASGAIAEAIGYRSLFALGLALSLAWSGFVLIAPVDRAARANARTHH